MLSFLFVLFLFRTHEQFLQCFRFSLACPVIRLSQNFGKQNWVSFCYHETFSSTNLITSISDLFFCSLHIFTDNSHYYPTNKHVKLKNFFLLNEKNLFLVILKKRKRMERLSHRTILIKSRLVTLPYLKVAC